VDFDLVPHKPPPNVNMYEEEVEEVEESESEEDAEDVEAPAIPPRTEEPTQPSQEPAPSTIQMPVTAGGAEEESDAGDEDDGLFAGGDYEVEEEEESGVDEAMEEVPVSTVPANPNELKRKLVEDEEYD
jgi:transcription initiation factor TFIID subunit 9B